MERKCSIEKEDKVFFSHGGSTAIVVITPDNKCYKFFITYEDSKRKNNRVKQIDNEINICRILSSVCNHHIRYIDSYQCSNAKLLFKDCPKSYVDFLNSKSTSLCEKYFIDHPDRVLNKKFEVMEIEYCDYDSHNFIKEIITYSEKEIKKYLDIFFFQIIYTIIITQQKYPYFIHGDLFMRNILGLKEKDNGNYYRYLYGDKEYYVPQKKFFPKINDFGDTNLNKKYSEKKLFKSDYKDVYNILLEVYDGRKRKMEGIMTLLETDEKKKKFVKKYFSNFFNVKVIDNYFLNRQDNMKFDWNNILDDEFRNSIQMKNSKELLQRYFYNIFKKKPTNLTVEI